MMDITEFLEQNSPESSTRSTATMKRPRVAKVNSINWFLYLC